MDKDTPGIKPYLCAVKKLLTWSSAFQSHSEGSAKSAEGLPCCPSFGGAPWEPATRSVRPLLFAGLSLLILACLAVWIDHPLSSYMVTHQLPDVVEEICHAAEPFGNGLTVVLLLVVIYRLVPHVRPFLPRVAAISLGAGLSATVVKLLIPRFRPRHFDFTLPIWQTFQAAFDFPERTGAVESFPSGHTATACGLAIGLSWLWPEGRVVFWTLAVLVAAQRVVGGAHFLSDVLAAAALSCFVGAALLSPRLAGRTFSALEVSLRNRLKDVPPENAEPRE